MNKRTKRNIGAMITGTIMTGALLGASSVSANELFECDDLGSGAELRADLLDAGNSGFKSPEAKCGEGKCGDEKSSKATKDSKASDHKCGEGKCGEEKSSKAMKDSKSSDHKCGEGKCGEEKSTEGSDKSKTDEADPK